MAGWMKCPVFSSRTNPLPAEVDAQKIVEALVVGLEKVFETLPGGGVHPLVFSLIAFSRDYGLPMRQSEKFEDAFEDGLRVLEEVLALEHEQLLLVEVFAPLLELVHIDAPR